MTQINLGMLSSKEVYLFAEIRKKIDSLPDLQRKNLINLGAGDVTGPLCPTIFQALQDAVQELSSKETFRGYGPEQGYDFLRKTIAEMDYQRNGIPVSFDEIFISEGAKSDCANFYDILGENLCIGIPDPVYPAYEQAAWIGGRGKAIIHYIPCKEENNFIPQPPEFHLDVIHLCSPNNPTGVAFSKDDFKRWVDYALEHQSILVVDGAYEAFLQKQKGSQLVRSIYEIPKAKQVAVELRSFSKTAGFTGLRCSYMVAPKEASLLCKGTSHSLQKIWEKRQDGMFNGVAYPTQKAAQACYTKQGQFEIQQVIDNTMKSAKYFCEKIKSLGFVVYGGEHAPYIWAKIPKQYTSWGFFDFLLKELKIVCVPGSGFGKAGEGFVRFSAFGESTLLNEAISRLQSLGFSKFD